MCIRDSLPKPQLRAEKSGRRNCGVVADDERRMAAAHEKRSSACMRPITYGYWARELAASSCRFFLCKRSGPRMTRRRETGLFGLIALSAIGIVACSSPSQGTKDGIG